MNKINYRQFVRLLLVIILIISVMGLFYMTFFEHYISEVHISRALPISILAGLSAIAVAIIQRGQ